MVDDSAAKNILNPTANFIVYHMWIVKKIQDRFLLDLSKYLQAFWDSRLPVNHFVKNNPIGERYLDPQDHMYRELFSHAKFNKLI
jgi:hypothetical protein